MNININNNNNMNNPFGIKKSEEPILLTTSELVSNKPLHQQQPLQQSNLYYPQNKYSINTPATLNSSISSNKNPLDFETFYQFKDTLEKILDSNQFQNDYIAIITKILGPGKDIVFRKCSNESECRELVALLKPSSYFFKVLLNNFSNDTNQFYFPFDRVPKNTIFKTKLLNQNEPKIINQVIINGDNRAVVLNMFQFYFFAFGLFSDHMIQEYPLIEQKQSSFLHQRTIHGIPTFSHNRQLSSPSLSSSQPLFNQQRQPFGDKTKKMYHYLFNYYLSYFLPFSSNQQDVIIDPFRSIDINHDQSLTFLKIICECLFAHNLTNQSINNLNSNFYQQLLMGFKKPTPSYLETIKLFLLHYQSYSYSFNYLTPSVLQHKINEQKQQAEEEEEDDKNENEERIQFKFTKTLDFYFKQREIVFTSTFEYFLSIFERIDFNEISLMDKMVNIWIYFITPWDPATRTTINKDNIRKSHWFENYIHSQDYQLKESNDLLNKWEYFIIEHYYFYSLIFNLLIIRSSILEQPSIQFIKIFKTILKVFNQPILKQHLKKLSKYDEQIQFQSTKLQGSNDIFKKLFYQLDLLDIKSINGGERNLFSAIMSNHATNFLESLQKKFTIENQKDYQEFIKSLCEFYDFQEPEFNQKLFNNFNIKSGNNFNISNSNILLNSQNNPSSLSSSLSLLLQSPSRNKDGTLSDLGRKQIHDAKITCTSDNLTYPYEKLISNPIALERAPISSEEIGIFIKIGYLLTNSNSARLYIRKFSHKKFLIQLFISILFIYLFSKILFFFIK